MSSFDTEIYKKIVLYYQELGEKKLLKKSLKNINTNKKDYIFTIPNIRIFLFVHCLNLNLF